MSRAPDARLIGRDRELQRAADELEHLGAPGRVITVVGEPGIGKTAFLAQLAADVSATGVSVLNTRGTQSEAQLPFAALHQLVRPLLPRADQLPGRQREALLSCFGMSDAAETNPFFAALAVLELLVDRAAGSPVLVCVDDLQWVDRPSTKALSFVARRIADESIAFVCATREPDLSLGDDQTTTFLTLTGLDEEASAALLETRAPRMAAGLAERVLRQAAGNPLALLELAPGSDTAPQVVGEWDGDLPMSARLESAFVARADRLDPVQRAVLDVAALDDGDDLADVLAAARILRGDAIGPAAVSPLIEFGLLSVEDGTYRIPHPLVRSALRQVMTTATRQQVHAALAQALSDRPHRAVWHRAASVSEPDEQIASALEAAAVEARRRGALSVAASSLERAAALSPEPGSRATRLLGAAELGYELGRFAQVEEMTAKLSHMALGVRERSRLTWLEGVFHDGSTSDPAEIRHLIDLAQRSAADDDVDLSLQLLVGAARRVWWSDPGQDVRHDIVAAARSMPLTPEDPRLLAVLGLSDSVALSSTVVDRAAGWPADAGGRADLAGMLGIAAFCVGDHARADGHLSAAIGTLREQGRLSLLAEALAIRSWAEINLGVFDRSRSADEAMRLADETGQAVWAATARIAIAVIDAVGSGSHARSALLVEAEKTALRMPNASSALLSAAQLVRGIALLGSDRPEPAYGELHRTVVPSDPAYQGVQQFWTVSYLAEAAVRTGRRDEAAGVVSSLERLAGPSPAPGPRLALEYSRAVLADTDDAERLLHEALAGEARSLPWHRARLELAHGSWLRRQRRVLESRAPLRAARSTFDALAAHPWAVRADQELRATGERGWRSAPNPRAQLSPQEAQIAELAAEGLSNRAIGEHLFLSHRTVSSHLYRIFPKLGITSRSQLAGALAGGSTPAAVPGAVV